MLRHNKYFSCESASKQQLFSPRTRKTMLSDTRKQNLSKMYDIVGSHSAVKLCRWQKSSMRGQGGCYKHTMYGIASSQCMEATPSVACANKCSFCWRHLTNPSIGDQWPYEVDDPEELVEKLVGRHVEMVTQHGKELQDVTEERFEEAKTPKHVALSLVGEAITYPRINEFVTALHRKNLSTFLVNNGQYPDKLANMKNAVTQLYLSIDATDKQTMKTLDRPLFKDFFERHRKSIEVMATRQERTVFRVTCIEDMNMSKDDVKRLAEMTRVGKVGFIELKQITPAWSRSTTQVLRIDTHVPTWSRMIEFAQQLAEELRDDGFVIPSVHEHSSCILLVDKTKYFVCGKWMHHIDFSKFLELVLRDPTPCESKSWNWSDYRCEVPDWALLEKENEIPIDSGNIAGLGFDPEHTRVLSKRAKKARESEEALKKKKQV